MENPFENYTPNLFPRCAAVAEWVVRKLSIFPDGANLALSTHIKHDEPATSGAEFMLAETLREQANQVIN